MRRAIKSYDMKVLNVTYTAESICEMAENTEGLGEYVRAEDVKEFVELAMSLGRSVDERIRSITDHLDSDRKNKFRLGLITHLRNCLHSNNADALDEFLCEWEDIADLDAIPGFHKNVWKAYEALLEKWST